MAIDESSCVSPFIFDGRTTYGCVRDSTDKEKSWCSLTSNYDRDTKWTHCSQQNNAVKRVLSSPRYRIHTQGSTVVSPVVRGVGRTMKFVAPRRLQPVVLRGRMMLPGTIRGIERRKGGGFVVTRRRNPLRVVIRRNNNNNNNAKAIPVMGTKLIGKTNKVFQESVGKINNAQPFGRNVEGDGKFTSDGTAMFSKLKKQSLKKTGDLTNRVVNGVKSLFASQSKVAKVGKGLTLKKLGGGRNKPFTILRIRKSRPTNSEERQGVKQMKKRKQRIISDAKNVNIIIINNDKNGDINLNDIEKSLAEIPEDEDEEKLIEEKGAMSMGSQDATGMGVLELEGKDSMNRYKKLPSGEEISEKNTSKNEDVTTSVTDGEKKVKPSGTESGEVKLVDKIDENTAIPLHVSSEKDNMDISGDTSAGATITYHGDKDPKDTESSPSLTYRVTPEKPSDVESIGLLTGSSDSDQDNQETISPLTVLQDSGNSGAIDGPDVTDPRLTEDIDKNNSDFTVNYPTSADTANETNPQNSERFDGKDNKNKDTTLTTEVKGKDNDGIHESSDQSPSEDIEAINNPLTDTEAPSPAAVESSSNAVDSAVPFVEIVSPSTNETNAENSTIDPTQVAQSLSETEAVLDSEGDLTKISGKDVKLSDSSDSNVPHYVSNENYADNKNDNKETNENTKIGKYAPPLSTPDDSPDGKVLNPDDITPKGAHTALNKSISDILNSTNMVNSSVTVGEEENVKIEPLKLDKQKQMHRMEKQKKNDEREEAKQEKEAEKVGNPEQPSAARLSENVNDLELNDDDNNEMNPVKYQSSDSSLSSAEDGSVSSSANESPTGDPAVSIDAKQTQTDTNDSKIEEMSSSSDGNQTGQIQNNVKDKENSVKATKSGSSEFTSSKEILKEQDDGDIAKVLNEISSTLNQSAKDSTTTGEIVAGMTGQNDKSSSPNIKAASGAGRNTTTTTNNSDNNNKNSSSDEGGISPEPQPGTEVTELSPSLLKPGPLPAASHINGQTNMSYAPESLVVLTWGGNGEGAKCNFPFIYNGETYFNCITVGHDKPWCSTTASYDRSPRWGYCDQESSATVDTDVGVGVKKNDTSAAKQPTTEGHINVDLIVTDAEALGKTMTFGGNAGGRRCVLPFIYDGEAHTQCIPKRDGKSWCAVTHSYDVSPLWGNCCDGEKYKC